PGALLRSPCGLKSVGAPWATVIKPRATSGSPGYATRCPSFLPLRDAIAAQRLVAQMSSRRGADTRLRRTVRPVAAPHAFDPVRQVQQFAVGLIVEVAATVALAQHHLLRLHLATRLRVQLVTATVEVQRRVAAHELQHRAVARVDEGALKIDLQFIR